MLIRQDVRPHACCLRPHASARPRTLAGADMRVRWYPPVGTMPSYPLSHYPSFPSSQIRS